jgi:cobalt-zinc-cadmium efflux system membrane fusion protein
VRVEIVNPRERLKVGMFVTVNFNAGAIGDSAAAKTLVVPDGAVQRIADRTVVFVPTGEPGHFEIRDVRLGDPRNGLHPVSEGLKVGERVVTRGSFVLKTQSMKGELGEHGH